MSSPRGAPKYSVLILGGTQAGKSAFIEHVRSYADPDYVVDESLLGDGITSKTDTTIPFLIESNLPSYEAFQKNTGETFDLSNLAAQYKDDEDYRDVLLSNAGAVSMRMVSQDPVALSQSMEFRLLDTPGLNGTQGKDSEHAARIVNEIISTRSFNLIVFVISSKSPLTEEKQVALEYFAYVLRGLHSRIIFLHTHVDYSKSHHSNTSHHLDMSMRSKAISRIFRRHDGESVFDEVNIKEYPCFNIDLTARNRPIVQCMIRNTIRQILTMATAPAATIDTSTGNIERIRTTTYPTEFGMEQRKALEATLRRKIAKPKYSVLIIGDTQASESSLIEHIKNYASLTYAVDQPLHRIGNLSKSGSSRPLYVESNLPAYEVYQRDTGEAIAVESLATSCKEEEDYRDIIFLRERDVGLRLAPQDPINPSNNIELWLLDSLGLETCDENDGNHAAITIDKLVHIETFNLIVIIESFKSPLTQERQLALEYFANVFKGLHSRIMFLHTHVSYADLHHTNSVRYLNIKLKNTALSKLFRRFNNEITFDTNNFKEYPSLTIDLVSKKRPVITCLIQNTIREILKMATQPAVLFDTSIQNIERVRAIPCPRQFTDEQLKQAKVRLQANADKFKEEQAEVVAHTEEQAEVVAHTEEQAEVVAHTEEQAEVAAHTEEQAEVAAHTEEQAEVAAHTEEQAEVAAHTEVQAEKPVKKASRFSYLFAPFRKLVPRRRRMQFECELEGGYGGDQSHYESHHGGIPPLVPIAPIGDLDEVVVEDKDHPGGPTYGNNFPGGPTDGGYYPGGPTYGNNFPGGPTDGGYYPGGPTDGNNIPGGPSGNGGVVPPVGGGSHSHLPDIIGGVIGGAIIGGAIASHKKKDKETVTHGHVTPVPVPGGPSTSTESTENHHGGSVYPVTVPGGPNSDNSTNQPSGSGGVFPIGGSSSTETSHHYGKDILIGGAVAGAVIGGAIIAGKRNDSSDSLSKTTRTTAKTTVTATKNGDRIFTTTGSGGRTVVTERTETGAARHIITGVVPGQTTVRTITQRTETGEEILVPVDEPEGDCREVVTERSENGKIRYIIGGIIAGAVAGGIVHNFHSSSSSSSVDGGSTTISSSTRIVTERSSTGEVRYIIVGGFSGNAVRVITERTLTGETRLIPTNEPSGELRHVIAERSESGEIRYVIGGIIAGGIVKTVTESSSSGSTRVSVVSSSTRIITERTSTGEIRYIIVGGFSGNAIRVITERTSTGETRLIPTNEESGELRHVISERSESGEIRYIIGGVITSNTVTRVIMGPRIVTERTSSGEIRYVIIDQYNGNAIRTKFERNEETGEFVHTPVKEPEGELRYVTEERTESGEIRKVIGTVITGNVTTTTRIVSGGVVPEGTSSSSQTRIVSEQTESGEIRYYQITIVDGKEVRTIVERTEDGGFRIPGGAIIVGAGATLIGNNHHTTTATTRVVGGGTLTPAEQAANKTQITLKLSIMRYERSDASAAIPSAAVGTVMFSKFKMLAAGDVNIEDTAYSHVEETKAPMSRRTLKWMKTEAHWKRGAGMLQHLKSDRYIADLYTLYSLPTFAEYRYVSVLGSFSRTLESYMLTQRLNGLQIRQLTLALSDALRWCHEHHVVHLNVRPSSFYLDGVPGADGTNASGQLIWKLWNFDHARFVGESVDTSVTTMTYAAPEILNACKNKTDPIVSSAVSMDRWSLGLILYELHIGKPYFVNAADAELQLTTNEGSRFQVDLEDVKEMNAKVAIRGLLEVDVEKRYTHETLCEVISAVVTENVITSKLNVPGGNVPKGDSNPKHGAKTAESGSGSDEPSASSSVLVLGKTQAGKSTFIEFVKNYANQQYIINESLLGTGIESKTQMPVQFVVKTPLLSYEVFDATGTRIDIGSLGDQYQDPDDYFDALNNRNATLKPVFHDAASSSPFEEVEITFLDTPGIEDTNGKDAEHAKKIIDAMTKMQSFNLIIIIISCEDTPSKSYQLAFNYYSEVIQTFQGHHSNIVFLYTHVEYEKCHHSNADHLSIMERRHKAFSQLFRRQGSYNHEDVSKSTVEPYPMYNIDFDKRQRPITKCMRLMTLREILTHIVSSPAVALDTSVSNLQQIRNIVHPDEPNQAQWKRLSENTRAIVEQGQGLQGCRDAPTASRECARSLEVNSRGAYNEDRATGLSICERGDWEGYFPKAMSDCSNSGDEDNDDHAYCLDSSVSLGCVARTHCDDMAKMIPAVVQEQ